MEGPMIMVKGGTTRSSHDALMAQQRHDTEQRRAAQAAQYNAAQQSPLEARMTSMKLGGQQTSAMVVLAIKHKKDNLILDWIVCEVSQQGPDDMLLVVACPECHARNPDHEPAINILQSNRKWWLDPRPPKWMRDMGAERIWVNPVDGSTVVVAGSVTSQDWMRCPGLGCSWHFRIEDSVVHSK